MSVPQYSLIFEGPQGTDADSLRALRAVFIGELNCSIEETMRAFESYPVVLKTSDSQDSLEDMLVALITAGAKAHIEEQIGSHQTASQGSAQAETTVLAIEKLSFETDPTVGRTSSPASNPATLVLTPGQSSLLSLDDDFIPPEVSPQAEPSKPERNSAPEPAPLSTFSLDDNESTENAPPSVPSQPISVAATPSVPSSASSTDFSLSLAEPDPMLQESAPPPLPDEQELEIHFDAEITEPIEPGRNTTLSALPSSSEPLTVEGNSSRVSVLAHVGASTGKDQSKVKAPPPPVARSTSTQLPELAATGGEAPPSAPLPQQLIPNMIPSAGKAERTPAPHESIPSSGEPRTRMPMRVFGIKIPSVAQDFITSVLIPMAILILGNVIYFSFIAAPTGGAHPGSFLLSGIPDLGGEGDTSSTGAGTGQDGDAVKPGPHSGTINSGDFTVEWKAELSTEQFLTLSLSIIPPKPLELTPQEIVTGKKPPLKILAVEIDNIALTAVGTFSISGSGPARLAIVDDQKTLRAIANAQMAIQYDRKRDTLTGDILIMTDNIGETPLRWLAERTESGKPRIRLKLEL